jgi:hypothetical protein
MLPPLPKKKSDYRRGRGGRGVRRGGGGGGNLGDAELKIRETMIAIHLSNTHKPSYSSAYVMINKKYKYIHYRGVRRTLYKS